MKDILLVGCGGFVGSVCRFLIGKLTNHYWSGGFPLATFMVNMLGCMVIGILFGLLENHKILSPSHNLLLVTGFCGGFTTFSTFANESWMLGNKGDWAVMTLYLAASVIGGILCVWAGRAIIR